MRPKPGRPPTGRVQIAAKPWVSLGLFRYLGLQRRINNKSTGIALSELWDASPLNPKNTSK